MATPSPQKITALCNRVGSAKAELQRVLDEIKPQLVAEWDFIHESCIHPGIPNESNLDDLASAVIRANRLLKQVRKIEASLD